MSGSETEDEMVWIGDFEPDPDPLVVEDGVVDKRYREYQFDEDSIVIYDTEQSTAWVEIETDHCIKMTGDVAAQLRGEE